VLPSWANNVLTPPVRRGLPMHLVSIEFPATETSELDPKFPTPGNCGVPKIEERKILIYSH